MRWFLTAIVLAGLLALAVWLLSGPRSGGALSAPLAEAPAQAPQPAPAPVEAAAPEPERHAAEPSAAETRAAIAAAPPASIPALTLRGRCVDSQARPLAGVEVRCWIYYWAPSIGAVVDSRDYATFDEGKAPTTASDAQGSFELAVAPEQGGDSAAFRVKLKLQFAGRTQADLALELARGGSADAGEIVLPLGARLAGRVVDAHGQPVAETRVMAHANQRAPDWAAHLSEGSWGRPSARSAADGSFALEGVPPGQLQLNAFAEDQRRSPLLSLKVDEGIPQQGLELVLPALDDAGSISGIVVSQSGEPQPRARIRLGYTRGQGGGSMGLSTDAQGRFRTVFDGQDGRLTAEDSAGKLGFALLEGVQPGMHDLRLVLEPPRMLALRALDASGPVASFGWSVKRQTAKSSYQIESPVAEAPRPDGRAELRAPPDPFWVELRTADHVALELGPFDWKALPDEALFQLERSAGIRGRVLRGGAPLAGAQLVLWRAVGEGQSGLIEEHTVQMLPMREAPTATSAVDGSFSLQVAAAGRYHVLASAPDCAPAVSALLEYGAASGVPEVVLELTPGGGIEGRAFAFDGSPLARQWISANSGWPPIACTQTDAQGAFHFEHLPSGSYRLRQVERPIAAQPRGWGEGSREEGSATPDCEVREGQTTHCDLRAPQPARLVLRLAPEVAALGDWRVDAYAQIGGATVDAHVVPGSQPGEYHIECRAQGRCTVNLDLAGADPRASSCTFGGQFELPPGETRRELRFAAGSIRGHATGADGPKTRIDCQRVLSDEWTFRAHTVADASGAFEFALAPEGNCTLSRAGSNARREIAVRAGESADAGEL